MYGWMDGSIDGWTDGGMYGWIDEWLDGRMDGLITCFNIGIKHGFPCINIC